MAINFPTSLDILTNPTGWDNLDTVGVVHSDQHSNVNDAIEALEAKVGIDGSAVTTSHDYKLSGVTGSNKAMTTGTMTTQGDIIYWGASGVATRLWIGGANTVLHWGTIPSYSAVVEADLTLADNTTNNATSLAHGFLPKLSGNSSQFLNGQGNYATPSGTTNSYTTTTFTSQTSVNVIHNFGTYPVVQVLDGTGAQLIPLTVTHNTVNDFTVTFIASTSGTIIASVGSPQPNAFITVNSNYTVLNTDSTVNCSTGNFTVTLPTAVGQTGRIFRVKNSGNGTITLATTSSQTIDGNASGTITMTQYDAIDVQSDWSNWIILASI